MNIWTLIALLPLFQFVKKSEKSNAPPPVSIKFYIQPPLSLVVIFPYAPLWFPNPLQVIIAQSLI